MLVNISFSDLYDIVARSLSIIGKRSVDDKGNQLFQDITIGTNEKEIINDFFTNGLSDVVAELSHFINIEQYNNGITNTLYLDWWQNEEVSTDLITIDGLYWYQPSTKKLYKSSITEIEPEEEGGETEIVKSWTEVTPSATTSYVDKIGIHYWWHNSTMERIGTGVGGSVTLNLEMHSNWNSAIEPTFVTTMNNYIVAYTLYSWFVITAPKIAEKYLGDQTRQLSTLIRLLHEKKAPKAPESSPLDINTEVETKTN